MESKRLSKIDKAFLVVIAGVLVLGVLVQAGYSFSGEDNTFGIDSTGEGYIEVHDVNISRDWFRGLVNVTDNILGVLTDLIPDAANTYDLGSTSAEWNDLYLGTGRAYFWTDQSEFIYSDGADTLVFGAGGGNLVAVEIGYFRPMGVDGTDLGSASNEWNDLFLGTGRAYFYTDQQEYIYSEGSALIFGVAGSNVAFASSTAFRPANSDVQSLGGTANEWEHLYIGTGGLLFWTDQGEIIRSTGSALTFRVDSTDHLALASGVFRPFNAQADNIDLGSTSAEWNDLYLGTGKVYFYTDQGESIYSNGTHLKIDGSSGILPDGGNNTGSIGADSERWASGWFTTMTAKSLVTGKVIEKELKPFPGESFEEGDVVKIYDSNYFVKSNKVLDHVVGVVVDNPEQIIVDYNVSWEMVSSEIPVTQEVEYVLNKTDAYGHRFEVIELRIENVYEYYLNPVEEKLSDGSTFTVYYNESRIVKETVWENVTTENPIFGEKGNPVLCVAGKAPVKISEPVLKNDILVAGPKGKARPFRTVLAQIKQQYSEISFNWNNVITVMEAFNLRMLGQVMEDSNGDYAQVMLW